MAFQIIQQTAWEQYRETINQIHFQLVGSSQGQPTGYIDFLTNQTVSGNMIGDMHEAMVRFKATIEWVRSVPNIAAYVQSVVGDPTYDPGAESLTVLNAIDSTMTYLISTVGSYDRTFTATGVDTQTYTPAQTATLRTNLQAIVDAIEGT